MIPWAKRLVDNERGVCYNYTYDAKGDVVAIYDDAGVLQLTYDYDAWGNTSHKPAT